MPRFDAQNLAIAVVIFTFGGVAWVCGTAHLADGKINLPDKTTAAIPGVESVAEPVVVEAHEFSSVVKLASEDAVRSVAVQPAEESLRKRLSAPQPSKTGTIRGRIVFDGTPPEHDQYFEGLPPVDAAVCGQTEHYDESLLVNPLNHGIRNVFIYLVKRKDSHTKYAPPQIPVKVRFIGCRVEPRCIAVQPDQELQFHYDDPVLHIPDMKPGLNHSWPWHFPRDGVGKGSFRNTEALPFPYTCAIHPWIRGWILVCGHPFSAITDADGNFVIVGVPHGEHILRVFHERAGLLNRSLKVVTDSDEFELPELTYDASRFGY